MVGIRVAVNNPMALAETIVVRDSHEDSTRRPTSATGAERRRNMEAYMVEGSETSTASLNPTEGHVLAGVEIDENRFIARVKPAQLFQMVVNPMLTEDEEERERNRDVQASWNVRRQVQRLFEGAKEKNVGPYARYICGLAHNQDGLTPVIELYSETPLKTQIGAYGTGWVQVPFELRFVSIDGETQLAARIEAA